MPLPREILERIGVERLAAQLLAERDRRRLWWRTLLLCVMCQLIGLFLVAWSMHTTSLYYGTLAFWSGLGIADGGTLFTLVAAWRIGMRKGWL
jgi:hypothetical protein